ncbi:Smr/MutS family protein [Chloroflexota bacterium]
MKAVNEEIDLHRLTVDEAIPRVKDFLQHAYRNRYRRVWIIHGKGTGTLRAEVWRLLAKHPQVLRYCCADGQHGGEGATQVEIKDK